MYKCKKCGYISAVKLGKCPSCGEFGSFEKEISEKNIKSKKKIISGGLTLNFDPSKIDSGYYKIEEKEFNRILPSGIKKGGVYLLGGEPGIGKSTIILQIIDQLLKLNNIKIGYFSGEENIGQIVERIKRLGLNFDFDKFKIYHSTIIEDILTTIEKEQFNFVIFDSIQTIYSKNIDSPAGSASQVKALSEKISEFSKSNLITSFVIGHITKSGEIAGPKYLEHIVDVVLYLEGDRFGQYRFLRAKKNRFGPSDEVGIFEMTLFGLKPVYDIKQRILNMVKTSIPGSVFTIGIDNSRPVLVNLEVLLNKTNYKYPKRSAIGIDGNRLDLIIAILERYLGLKLGYFDIFVNIPGEWKFYDSGLDLAIAVGIYSQYYNKIIDKSLIFLGEIGLSGQILPSKFHEKRKKELQEGFNLIDYTQIKNIIELKSLF